MKSLPHRLRTALVLLLGLAVTTCIAQIGMSAPPLSLADSLLARGIQLLDDEKYDQAWDALSQAKSLSEEAGADILAAKTDLQLGNLLCRTGELPAGHERQVAALAVFRALHDTIMMADAEKSVALSHKYLGRSPEALAHNLQALDLYERIQDTSGVARVLNNLAYLYTDQGDRETALAQLYRARALLEPGGNTDIRFTLTALAHVSKQGQDLTSALAYADQAIPLHRQAGDRRTLSRTLTNRASTLLALGRTKEALETVKEAIQLTREPLYVADAYYLKGQALKTLRRWDEAAAAFAQAESFSYRAAKLATVAMIKSQRARIYEFKGDYRTANVLLREYMAFRDSCGLHKSNKETTRMEMKHAFDKEQLADSLRHVESRLVAELAHQQQLASERNRRNLAAFTGTILALLVIGIWFRMRHIRSTRDMILRTQEQLVESEKLREAEQVRTRIARDIHDELGSELTKITMLSSEARHHASLPQTKNRDDLDRIVSLSRQVNSTLNDIVWAVDPLHDNVKDLLVHARVCTERILEGAHVRSEKKFTHSGPDRPIDPATKRNIFLLLKEALNNSLKYACAGHIHIALQTDINSFKLVVSDDGIGFDPQLMDHDGNGLRNMKARCISLNARLQIDTSLGNGCTITVAGPLP